MNRVVIISSETAAIETFNKLRDLGADPEMYLDLDSNRTYFVIIYKATDAFDRLITPIMPSQFTRTASRIG